MPIKPSHILWGAKLIFLAAFVAQLHDTVHGQRVKQGCYEFKPLVCEQDEVREDPDALDEIGMDFLKIERVCRQLHHEVFQATTTVVFDPSKHAEYLNGIAATDEFCSEIQAVYKYCSFCEDTEYLATCKEASEFPNCGNQPSREEVLADTTTYSLFNSDQDIVDTCNALEESYAVAPPNRPGKLLGDGPDETGQPHLGREGVHPPPSGQGPHPRNEGMPPPGGMGPPPGEGGHESDSLQMRPPPQGGRPGGGGMGGPPGSGLLIRRKVMPPSSSTLCRRQFLVKHLCSGECEGGCFTEEVPPTCNASIVREEASLERMSRQGGGGGGGGGGPGGGGGRPGGASLKTPCDIIVDSAFHFAPPEHILNVSKHADYLRAISGDSPSCQSARRAYSGCIWCDFSEDKLCFNERYPATCEAPSEAISDEFDFDEEEGICHDVWKSIFDLPGTIYNVSSHTGHVLIPGNTTRCDLARNVYHKCRWCAPGDIPGDFCEPHTACTSQVDIPDDLVLPGLGVGNEELTKEQCAAFPTSPSRLSSSAGCFRDISLARKCEERFCKQPEAPGDGDYLGASTTAQKRAIIWVSRVAAFLSFFGASYILYDSLSDPKARNTVYHQLLVGIAIFDIVTAVAWCFATAPIDANYHGSDHVEGAMGTEGTCVAQAFFVQLGFTSVFYNVSLALYYVLVIAHGWHEFQLKKIRLLLHGIPLTLGLGLAFGGIPFYGFLEYGCHITTDENSIWIVLVFVVLPLGLSIAAITAAMFFLYCKVRKRTGASNRWSLGQTSKLEQAVFWQCLFYMLAFYVTWPIVFAVYLFSVDVEGPLGLALTMAFVAPLQGFSNFLVYVRPKLTRRYNKFVKEVARADGSSTFTLMVRKVISLSRGTNNERYIEPSGASGMVPVWPADDEAGEAKYIPEPVWPADDETREVRDRVSMAAQELLNVRMTDPSVALAFSRHQKSTRMVLALASMHNKSSHHSNSSHRRIPPSGLQRAANAQAPNPIAELDESSSGTDEDPNDASFANSSFSAIDVSNNASFANSSCSAIHVSSNPCGEELEDPCAYTTEIQESQVDRASLGPETTVST